MFRKAQLKLFGIITSILLAIFIIVLASINIVTKTFMQRQSREVLQQIASGIEYDEKTDTFTFTPPDNFKPKHSEPPSPEASESTQTSVTESATEENTTTETVSEQTTEAVTEKTETTEVKTEISESETESETQPEETLPDETETEALEETEPNTVPEEVSVDIPETTMPAQSELNPPTENRQDNIKPPDFPPYDNRRPEDFPHEDEHNFNHWKDRNNWNYRQDEAFPQSYNNESYYITQLENTITEPAKKKPVNDIFDRKKEEPFPKSFGSIDFFVIMADGNGNYLACMNNDDLTSENAQKYINEILSQKDNTGMMNSYQFYNVKKNNGTLIALTDKSEEKKVMKQFIRTTIIIGALTLVVLSFAGYFLSKKSIEPIKTAFEKQKQFISDASHELKTPLTVISANADVLSGEIGENKWLNYIKSQTDRMNLLVNDLLSLTRLENNTSNFICTDFNLSQAVTNTALPFECRAFETNKKFIVDVEDGLTVNGSEQHIKQMTAIFIDNALKYSNDGGIVRVSLKKQGDKKVLSVYNTGSGVKDEEKDRIFERFYRSDDSRTRQTTGGYGLGLAIAKSIIDKHRFRITVDNTEGESISFIIIM